VNVRPEDKVKMRADWQSKQVNNHQGSVAVLDGGPTFTPISFTPEDASWIKSRTLICGLFHLSTQLVASEARVSGEVYASQMLAFYQLALKPLMIDLQQQLLQKIFPSQMSKYVIKHDWHSLLESDPRSTLDSLSQIRNKGH
jgi:phage portal protein BeeE